MLGFTINETNNLAFHWYTVPALIYYAVFSSFVFSEYLGVPGSIPPIKGIGFLINFMLNLLLSWWACDLRRGYIFKNIRNIGLFMMVLSEILFT